MKTRTILKEIKATGILPASYFPSRAFPHTIATERPLDVMAEFYSHAERWLEHYPQDAGTAFHTNLKRVQALITYHP